MYVNLEAKAIWLCHPRTASRSTAALLSKYGFVGVRKDEAVHKPTIPVSSLPFATIDAPGHHTRLLEKPEGWKIACTVRHHFEVVVSWLYNVKLRYATAHGHLDKTLSELDIVDFLNRLHEPRRIGGAYYPKKNELMPNLEHATFVAHYQFLPWDLRVWLLECFGRSPLRLELENTGADQRAGALVDDTLNDVMKAAITDRYEVEMRKWGFLVDDKPVGYK